MSDEDLLRPEYLDYYRRREVGPLSTDGRPLADSPLPRLAAHHYTTGGCYTLAGALAGLTGLRIGVTVDTTGLPLHAFVVHGSDYIDAFGRQPLSELSARERVVEGLNITQVADMLLAHENGGKLRADMRSIESKRYAVVAAEVILDASGLTRPSS
jgi:hypothetical protein